VSTSVGVIETARAKRSKVYPQPDTFELLVWAEANRIGENTAYEYCRREIDPMPHIKQGVRILVEPEPALLWLRRKFGIGYGEGS
jgi:hypothetical protein